ncbi:MAG: transporter substrate-binding domain-containing protein [Aliarcobacter sp.]|nr:transporter substrate-binding domain-containing protein [Aliarcobacter sp.]
MKKFNLGLLALLVFILVSCGGAKKSEVKKEESKVLRVGMECGYAPFNWFQSDDSKGAVKNATNGYCGGYDVEIAKLVAKGLGKDLQIVQTDWDGLLGPALGADKVDIVIAGMSPTEERKANLDFTDSYYKSDLVVVVAKDGKYANAKTLNDFKDAKITAQLNTLHYTVIDQLTGAKKVTAMENFPAMIVALSSKKIDGYISERPGAMAAELSNPNLKYIYFSEGQGFKYATNEVDVAIAVKKNSPELVSKINEILKGISPEQRKQIMEDAVKNQPLQK